MLGEIFKTFLMRNGRTDLLKIVEIKKNWNGIVGKDIATVSSPSSVKNRKLIIKVDEMVWKKEILFMEKEIVEKLNDAYKLSIYGLIVEIR